MNREERAALFGRHLPQLIASFEAEMPGTTQEIEKPAEGRASFKDAVNIPDPRGRKIEKPKPSTESRGGQRQA